MMKQFSVSVFALALSVCTWAAGVSGSTAAEIAAGLFGTSVRALQPARAPRANVDTPGKSDELYYIFNNPSGGFAIISAMDCTLPVLAYSSEGSFDTDVIPSNARAWLDAMEKELCEIRDSAVPATDETRSQWRAPSSPGQGAVLRETPVWNQGSPCNAMCPIIDGQYCLTGCVATAACEMMRYYCWPESRDVTIPAYTSDWHNVSVRIPSRGPAVYDWENMPMNGGNDAVALLMADVGAALRSNYGLSSTSAVSNNVVDALTTYFSYDKSASFQNRGRYSESEWEDTIRRQLDDCGPLFFRATAANPDAAHAFVLDGYDNAGYFHFNFGWSGSYNGWFLLTALGPASGYTFTADQSAAFDLVPDRTGTSTFTSSLSFSLSYGIKSDSEIVAGVPFSVKLGAICNQTPGSYIGRLRIVLKDIDGNIKNDHVNTEDIPFKCVYEANVSPGSVSCTLDSEPVLGDKLVVQYDISSRWKDVGYSSTKTLGELPLVPMYIITDPERNIVTNGNKLYKTAKWSSGRVVLTYADGTVETIVQE